MGGQTVGGQALGGHDDANDPQWQLTGVWSDTRRVPDALTATLDADLGDALALLRTAEHGRIVASGNGSSHYVALALWLASLTTNCNVVAVPAGILQAGKFGWRPGDVLLAISSSGELRDLIEALDRQDRPASVVALTSEPHSTLGRLADGIAPVTVPERTTATPTQDFSATYVGGLALLAALSGDSTLASALAESPRLYADLIPVAERWHAEVAHHVPLPRSMIVYGDGYGWIAALETALLLKELAGVHAEGVEAHELVHGTMTSLSADDLVVAVGAPRPEEPAWAFSGAAGLDLPTSGDDSRLLPLLCLPGALALSLDFGLRRGADPDAAAWAASYYATVRS